MSIHGLYAIADTSVLSPQSLHECIEQALRGGAAAVQYRDKSGDKARRAREASELRALTRDFGALLVINDDPALARDCEADGVHLGIDDGSVADARAIVGAGRMIGVSCYNDALRARAAAAQGADYIAFGSFHPSRVKPRAVRASIGLVRRAHSQLDIAIVAIGGIDEHNGRRLVAAGAAALAVISALFAGDDGVQTRARAIAALFELPGRRTR